MDGAPYVLPAHEISRHVFSTEKATETKCPLDVSKSSLDDYRISTATVNVNAHKFPLMLRNWNWINLQCFLRYFLSPFLGSIFHETGVCMIYKDTWYLNNLRRFLSSTPISWNGSSSKSGTCVALRWNSTGGPLVCNQTARGPAQWETQPFETNCWLASEVFFFHRQPFCEEKLLGTKRFVDKRAWESHHTWKKTHLDKGHSWTSHFDCIGTLFQVWMIFGIKFPSFQAKQTHSKNPPLPFVPLKTSSKTSGTGLGGGGRAAGHLWIASQAPGAILWWFWGHLGGCRLFWVELVTHPNSVASLVRFIYFWFRK